MNATDAVEQTHDSEIQESSPESTSQDFTGRSNNQEEQAVRAAMAELDKMERFKFDGQEWTPKDLKAAILRQKDYTNKTKNLSDERKAYESEITSERKFYENLSFDLSAVKNDPRLADAFLRTYPEKFHRYLHETLSNSQQQGQSQGQRQQVDTQLLSRLNKLESVLIQQDIAKNEVAINQQIESLSKKYPDAMAELAIAEVFEQYNKDKAKNPQATVTPEQWEKAFKNSSDKMENLLKTKYGNMVKKQTTANKKSADVEAGGGTPGRAPKKFKNLQEVTNFAESELTAGRS